MDLIKVSAPCRIDIGGTWDMDIFSLPYQNIKPSTITIALNYRTHVEVGGYKPGYICIIENDKENILDSKYLPFTGQFGLLNAIIQYFGLNSLYIKIYKEYPFKSGLGGSGSLAVCLISAILRYVSLKLSKLEIIKLAHDIENGLLISHSGYQDQCAAIYGGVKLWTWMINGEFNFEVFADSITDIQDRLVIVYTGSSHPHDINDKQIESFISGSNRRDWLEINENTILCGDAIRNKDWGMVSRCVSFEHKKRIEIVPERLSPSSMLFQKVCDKYDDGFGISGSGGCVFYFADKPETANAVKTQWATVCDSIEGAKMMEPIISLKGVLFE